MAIRIYAVGDIMMGDHPICLGHGVGSKISHEFSDFLFEKISNRFDDGDVIFGNLECVLSDKGINPKDPSSLVLRGSPSSALCLKHAGFNIVSLANNHAMQHGENALDDTKQTLIANGIDYIPRSISGDSNCRQELQIININNKSIGFLSYCSIDSPSSYFYCFDPEKVCSDIISSKEKCDILILSLHWGNEFVELPSPTQVDMAHDFIDAGCDIIFGHHPHVLQGIEEYKGRLIAYSLGNFVFDMWQPKMRESIILEVIIDDTRVNYIIHPIKISDSYQPELATDITKTLIAEKMSISKNAFSQQMRDELSYQKLAKIENKKYMDDILIHFLFNSYRYDPQVLMYLIHSKLSKLTKKIKL